MELRAEFFEVDCFEKDDGKETVLDHRKNRTRIGRAEHLSILESDGEASWCLRIYITANATAHTMA